MSALPDVSKATWQQEVLSSDLPVLVDFWAPWCGPCKMIAPFVENVAAANSGRAKFLKLNTDENPELAGQFHVSGIPCLILFKGGQAVDRIVGFVQERTIQTMLAKHLFLRGVTMLRGLPAVHRLLAEPSVAAFGAVLGNETIKATIHEELRAIRSASSRGDAVPEFAAIVDRLHARLAHEASAGLTGVLNGTGVLLHTNLGRAPLAREAIDAVREIAGGYSNLEFDLERGGRGSRYERVSSLVCAATGGEDALVVNNCAAAMLLVLDTLAKGREVIVSRNQAIEIGGGFRLPDVLERSGARLIDVGTTNKVYLSDFERALGPQTALLLRTHPSNFRIAGFVADVPPRELAALGHRVGVPTVEDLGSGALCDLAQYGLPHERTAVEAVADGIDLVAFSGDKLLGGPQAGIVVGRRSLVARLRANPLLRALRVDKGTLAALGATLRLHLEPGSRTRIPLYAMLATTVDALRSRARSLASALEGLGAKVEIVDCEGYVGAGTLPLAPLPSAALAITPVAQDPPSGDPAQKWRCPNSLAALLRRSHPPVVARVEGQSVLVDLRAIPPERDSDLIGSLREALSVTQSAQCHPECHPELHMALGEGHSETDENNNLAVR